MAQAQKSPQIAPMEVEITPTDQKQLSDRNITANGGNQPVSVKLQQAKIAALVLSGLTDVEIADQLGCHVQTCQRIAKEVEKELAELTASGAKSLMAAKFAIVGQNHKETQSILALEAAMLADRIAILTGSTDRADVKERDRLVDRRRLFNREKQDSDLTYSNTLKNMGVSHLKTRDDSKDPINSPTNNNLQLEATYRVIKTDPDKIKAELLNSAKRLSDYAGEIGD